jgi:hypothetical protein
MPKTAATTTISGPMERPEADLGRWILVELSTIDQLVTKGR